VSPRIYSSDEWSEHRKRHRRVTCSLPGKRQLIYDVIGFSTWVQSRVATVSVCSIIM